MKSSGKQLEQLIGEIEQHLLPEGFKVELNNRVFNDGIQLAEFDILITGRLGSSSIKWLIECRDRPSTGPAPGSWIEQLAGRKARFNFHQVIAVSTTGFAEGVKDFAEREGIILRTVRKVTDIGSDFRVQEFNYIAQQVKLVGPIEISPSNPTAPNGSVQILLPPNILFKLADEKDYQSIQDFVVKKSDVNHLGAVHGSKFRFDFRYVGLIDMLLNGEHVKITNLFIPVEFSTLIYTSKALAVNVYSENNCVIGQEANFNFDLPTGSFTYRVLILKRPDGMEEIRFSIPENIPDHYTLNKLHFLEENN